VPGNISGQKNILNKKNHKAAFFFFIFHFLAFSLLFLLELLNMRNLTCCEKAYICGLHDGGMSVQEIEVKTGVSASGIYKVLKRENEDQPPKSANPVGRPKNSLQEIRGLILLWQKETGDQH
jgi:hypothetical protein